MVWAKAWVRGRVGDWPRATPSCWSQNRTRIRASFRVRDSIRARSRVKARFIVSARVRVMFSSRL
jgi:hypothetical protein